MAPFLKILLMVSRNYLPSFMLLSQNAQLNHYIAQICPTIHMAAGPSPRGFYEQNHLLQESLLLAAAAAMSASLLWYSCLTNLWAVTDLWAGTYDNYLSYCHLQKHQGQEIVELTEPSPSSKGLTCNGYGSTLVSCTTL